jgi:tryptophan-rich sensory protein
MPNAHHHSTPKPIAHQLAAFLAWVLLCFLAAGIGGLVTAPRIRDWYAELAKPEWTPPDWIFGPVWTLLYLMMAIAAWMVWRKAGAARGRRPFTLFGIQLALNVLWSVLFFGLRSPGIAAVEVLLLWAAIAWTLSAFWRWSRWAGVLMVPYLVWVGYAAVLNWAIWSLNT